MQSVTGAELPELLEINAAIPALTFWVCVRHDAMPVVGRQPEPCAAIAGEPRRRRAMAVKANFDFMSVPRAESAFRKVGSGESVGADSRLRAAGVL